MASLATNDGDEYPLSSDGSDDGDDYNETSFMSRMSSTTTENEEDDQGLDRIRMLMLNYYGNEGFDEDEEEDEEAKMHDIDGENFDVDVYLNNLLKTETLPNLLKRSEELRKETRTLDSDMQNMVYENYSKFIRATDTIRTMKTDVTVIETELDKLMLGMETLGKNSGELDTALEPNRSKIENMLSLQSLIKKLEFLFELPMRLRRSIELEAYVQAVKYYNTANAILEKYSHVLSFGSIHKESIEIMSGLKDLMYQKLVEGKQTASGMGDLTKLLLQMEHPKLELVNIFINWTKGKLEDCTQKIKNDREKASVDLTKQDSTVTKFASVAQTEMETVWHTVEEFVGLYCQFGDTFKGLFLSAGSHSAENEDRGEIEKLLLSFTKEVFLSFFTEMKELFLDIPIPMNLLPDSEAGLAPKFLEDVADYDGEHDEQQSSDNTVGGGNPFTDNEEKAESAAEESEADETFLELVTCIARFRSSVHNAVVVVKAARLNDRLSEIIEKVVRSQITKTFEALQTTIILRISAVQDELVRSQAGENNEGNEAEIATEERTEEENSEAMSDQNNVAFLSSTLASVVSSDIEHTLRKVKILLGQCSSNERLLPDMDEILVDLVQGQLKHTLKWVTEALSDFCDGVGPIKAPSSSFLVTQLFLVASVAMQDFSQNGVTRAASVLLECLPVGGDGFDGNMLKVGELMKMFADVSKKLLSHFVLYKARMLSRRMRNSVISENWLRSQDVTAVRPAILDFIKELTNSRLEISNILGESASIAGTSSIGVVTVLYGEDNMDNKGVAGAIDRIFSDKVVIFGDVEFKSNSVSSSIFKIVLKALSESLRCQTFSRRGFQQVELDANYLHNILPSVLVSENDMLVSLIKELMTSAGERCLNPEHLEKTRIQELLLPELE